MVQPRIARMTRIMFCAFVQIRVIRGCLTYTDIYIFINSAEAGFSNAVFYNRNVSSNGIDCDGLLRIAPKNKEHTAHIISRQKHQ